VPNFVFNNTVPAAGTTPNALAGSPFEFVGVDSKVAIALAEDRTGGVAGQVTANIHFGAELQLQSGAIMVEREDGAGALIPNNVIVDDVARAGDRLVIELVNSAVGARDIRGIVRILPIG